MSLIKKEKNTKKNVTVQNGRKLLQIQTENAKLFGRLHRWIMKHYPERYHNPDQCDHIATPKHPKCAKCGKKVTYQ
jgi:hypothetical protein